jgi:hypothetical protein
MLRIEYNLSSLVGMVLIPVLFFCCLPSTYKGQHYIKIEITPYV